LKTWRRDGPGGRREKDVEFVSICAPFKVESEVLKAMESEGGLKTRGGRDEGGLQ